jgi:tRNA-specific 2-thiouridylase
MKKILVWLSWWVDSAVSAYLLKQAWYDITAWFMINYLAPEWEYCPTLEDIEVAKEVAKYLDIPFFPFDYREEYEKKVLNYMYEWYKNGITPNPDVMCNSEIKFKVFLQEAIEQGFDAVATWHYAQIIKTDLYYLKKWCDENKDQSYFLAWLDQYQLSKSLFPIWHLKKSQVREIALKAWLPNALRKESQWICFVGKVDVSKFLEKKIQPKIWNIIDTSGNILWTHNGVFYYTIWQRKWLNIWWLKDPVFVIKKDLEKNILMVWTQKDVALYSDHLVIKHVHFLSWKCIFPLHTKAKIRYRQSDQNCQVFPGENDTYSIVFNTPQRAIASGQIVALYDENDFLIMSGVIE